jgi:hypothetical protein
VGRRLEEREREEGEASRSNMGFNHFLEQHCHRFRSGRHHVFPGIHFCAQFRGQFFDAVKSRFGLMI